MLSKAKYWMGIGKPKNQHSLENLKYLFAILNKNQIVTENNKDLLIETLRSISEILIWGDQNDSSVFDFFLEKQMITFFLQYMKQKYGRYICVQLLQTLNILFENIRNETSLYFLLSNNHINNIILNKFDFSDEEVMAYYISFLKTLSLKLNSHSIHFFFNERASEFPLYVEALKFFDHPEAMVRIAVRTLTLNIFRVPVQSMQKFVKEKTAVCYFSNLVWLIRNHVLDLDACIKNTIDHTKKCRLIDLIDEYIDHLSYIQDIYKLNIQSLSNILSEQLIRRLFVPVYLSSILHKEKFVLKDRRPIITPIVATFLLSHVFSIIEYAPLLSDLCELIFGVQEEKVFDQMCSKTSSGIDYLGEPVPLLQYLSSLNQSSSGPSRSGKSSSGSSKSKTRSHSVPHFNQLKSTATSLSSSSTDNNGGANAAEGGTSSSAEDQTTSQVEFGSTTLAQASSHSDSNSLDNHSTHSSEQQSSAAIATSDITGDEEPTPTPIIDLLSPIESVQQQSFFIGPISDSAAATSSQLDPFENITDDEKRRMNMASTSTGITSKSTQNGVIFESLLQFLNVQDYDEMNALIALSFFYTLMNNPGLPSKYLELVKVKLNKTNEVLSSYDDKLMSKLIGIVSKSVESDFRVRLSTLDLTIKLIKIMTILNRKCYISDFHLACIEQAREQSSFILRRHFKSEEMFLDMFEHEYNELNMQQHQFDSVLRDWSILLPPTSTPLSLIEFTRRFPCGDTEKLKQNIRTFFYLRDLCLSLTGEFENQLPLTKQEHLVKENNALDLNSSDLIACTVNLRDKKDRRFLVIDPIQFILVEPEVKRIGWGIVKFSDLIQDVEVSPDKEDSRSLNITIKKTNLNGKPEVILNSIFTFDDHIRCMAAKQHLIRARDRARRIKLEKIAQLLDIASCSNNNQSNKSVNSTPPSNPASAADILSYNLVAGFNMFNTINPPGRASMITRSVSGFNSSAPTLYRPPNGPSQFVASPLPSLSHSQSSPSSAQKDAAVNNSISTTTQVDDLSSQFSNTNDQVMMTPTSNAPTSPSDVSLVNNDTPSLSSSPSPTSPHKSRDSPSTPKTPKSATRLGEEFIA